MSIGLDIGTAFIAKGEIDSVVQEAAFTKERNAFLQASSGDDTEDILKENSWSYAKYENNFYILGEDAIKIKNLLTMSSKRDNQAIVSTKVGDLRRPMKDGILNTADEKLSVAMIQKIIGNLVGQAKTKNENLCFCAPGDPVNKSSTTLFHKTILTNYLKGLGYTVECIPEALAIIYSERPVADDPDEEDGQSVFTGIGISCGGGMANICLAKKKMPLINFSIVGGGDWIDQQAAQTTGIDVSAMTKYKESHLDLANIDYSDMKQAALDVFYQSFIENVLSNFAEKFNTLDNKIETPLEIVLAGGTSSVPGFLTKFQSVLSTLELPFQVKCVKLASNPLYTVANGCLIKAISSAKKATKG